MTSFPAQAGRARNGALGPQRRLYALRECALHFAPYGFRASWHHLIISARIPKDLGDDPEAVTRAIDELSQARELMLPLVVAYAARRRREKADRRRVPPQPPAWNAQDWRQLAYCPDPELHPTSPLPAVVAQILERLLANLDPDEQCLACGTPCRSPHLACPTCGVQPVGQRVLRPAPIAPERWRRIWSRDL